MPEVIRSTPSVVVNSIGQPVKFKWRRDRHDENVVIYAASRFASDAVSLTGSTSEADTFTLPDGHVATLHNIDGLTITHGKKGNPSRSLPATFGWLSCVWS